MPVALRCDGVGYAYPAGTTALAGIDLRIDEGEFVALAGPNGGGKTTLVRLAVGLLRPTEGRVELFGEAPWRADRGRVAYLAQRAQLGVDAPVTVRELVAAGRTVRRGVLRRLGRRDHEAVDAAIERVGLAGRARTPLRRLSGGQQQRAFIAKALAAEPRLLVLDEPTTGVDAEAQEAFAGLLAELHAELGVTILYVSHEFGAVEGFVRRLVLVRHTILFDGDPSSLAAAWHDPSHVHP